MPSQLVPFSSAASDLVIMLLNGAPSKKAQTATTAADSRCGSLCQNKQQRMHLPVCIRALLVLSALPDAACSWLVVFYNLRSDQYLCWQGKVHS